MFSYVEEVSKNGSADWCNGVERIDHISLPEISFYEAREIQNELVLKRHAGKIGDTVLFCEHPLTVSLGYRSSHASIDADIEYFKTLGADIIRADRGGGATLHLPGQLLVYPVIGLKDCNIGVKEFVNIGLRAIQEILEGFDISVSTSVKIPGVWVHKDITTGDFNLNTALVQLSRKIASVGLRICRGVTNHGFAVNLSCDLTHFTKLTICNSPETEVTSVANELRGERLVPARMDIERVLLRKFAEKISSKSLIKQ